MKIIHDIDNLQLELKKRGVVAFVPTMGNIHEGHLSLVKIGKQNADTVVCSIFVNKLQFNEKSDFLSYPRTFDVDVSKLGKYGTDIVFAPHHEVIYPCEQEFFVETPGYISDFLEGEFRPNFFSRVATIVIKLLFLIKPDFTVFGKKDFQQAFMIKKLIDQFCIQSTIIVGETIREQDGLALSSRNSLLNGSEREAASLLFKILVKIREEIIQNKEEDHFDTNFLLKLENQGTSELNNNGWKAEYIKILNKKFFSTPSSPKDEWFEFIILAAARLGNTRLIDNLELNCTTK